MDDLPRTTHLQPPESAASTNLTTFLHSLVPPYFLQWGPLVGVGYALVSVAGFLCHIIFMAYIIVWIILKGLDWLTGTAALPEPLSAIATGLAQLPDTVDLPTGLVLSFMGWWFISSVWMAATYKRHHDGTSGWRAYMFGGGWAWRFWKRGDSDGDFDFDFD